ncbi:MAG TPA: NAD(P)H-binding protein [Vicinamibacterales bacterium]|nr:NAD(P)H-binding protein [Vicinamibacterales bacterium]
MTVAITGANSGAGRILLHHLADRSDTRVVACVRSGPSAASLPITPRVSVHAIDYDDRSGLASVLTGSRAVVHLAGILFESPSSSYHTANVAATQAVTDACTAAGVAHMVLVSALGADPRSTNPYWRSKGHAERIVVDSGLAATIIRTPILLGPGMAGARAVVQAASQRTVTLLGGGRHSIRPLDVDDLSWAILRCCDTVPLGRVMIHELVGPESTTYCDVVARTAALLGREVSVRSMPIWLAKLGAALAGWKRCGGMTPSVIDVITSSEVVRANADVALGVTLTPLSATLRKLLPSGAEGTCAQS